MKIVGILRHVDLLLDNEEYLQSVMIRLLSKYSLNKSDCWNWTDSTDRKGRATVTVGRCRHKSARVMYVCHYRKPVGNLYVLHTCDNILCINPSHLWLGTHEDNMQDMRNKDRSLRGSKNVKAKLSDNDVLDIKSILREGDMKLQEIADKYGVTKGTISQINTGRIWSHI